MEREKLLQRLNADDKHLYHCQIEAVREKMKRSLEVKSKCTADEVKTTENGGNDDLNNKYRFDQRSADSMDLPIYHSKDEILANIAKYPNVVIEGNTGCGKSTQIPQMILDDAIENKRYCNIVVTQPRRIAARSVAERVSRERGWELGTVVGYQVGLDKNYISEDTRIRFCTTGVLLEQLIKSKSLDRYTHIVLDEVHERDKDMDFLFIIIKMLRSPENVNVKVILMSATIDTNMFSKYFEFCENKQWYSAPVVKVDKRNPFNVYNFYLDDLENAGLSVPHINYDALNISEQIYMLTLELIKQIMKMDPDPFGTLPSILVFLPGIFEIGRLKTVLMEYDEDRNREWKIFILHSLISSEEQRLIFAPAQQNVRKIILSTNIAESSITVPDVKYVIDFCLTKYMKSHSSKNFTSLEMDWASKNNCRQRTGRAGRVSNGRCYRLVHRNFYRDGMKESPIPELLLTPLENIVLKAKSFDMEAPHVVLGMAMLDSIPKLDEIANTILTLKELGALKLTYRNSGYQLMDGDITFMGRIMSALPVDIRATRLIALGYCFGVLEECVIMAAGISSKGIFKLSFDNDLKEYTRRLEWSNGSGSDLFAILNAYSIWTLKYNQQIFGKSTEQQVAERDFCKKHCLDMRTMHEVHYLVQELTRRIEQFDIKPMVGSDRIRWTEKEKCIILKVVIAGAFYPNFFSTEAKNETVERDALHILNGRDPNTTVYFSGFREENIRELYVVPIRKYFQNHVVSDKDLSTVKVSFEPGNEKVFVTFEPHQKNIVGQRTDWDTHNCSLPGKTLIEVHKAVKMRQMRMDCDVQLIKQEKEKMVAEHLGLGQLNGTSFKMKNIVRDPVRDICIPNSIVKEVIGKITHVENCSKFWFQPESETKRVEQFQMMLNNGDRIAKPFTDFNEIPGDETIVALNHTDRCLYRARLVSRDFDNFTQNITAVTVWFIDFGHSQNCRLADLYSIDASSDLAITPPRCFQARLAEIKPSAANVNGGNSWDNEANDILKKFIGNNVKAQIFSVVNAVANVFIWPNDETNLNNLLIEEEFGEFSEESHLSKTNHLMRQKLQSNPVDDIWLLEDCEQFYPINDASVINSAEHADRHYGRKIKLRGPNSPLETKIYPVLAGDSPSAVLIDTHSVNSVLLTSMQQESTTKYLVAAQVSCLGSHRGKKYTIQETTLLPSIRGLGPLLAMIFCPTIDLERDQHKSRYISVLTGLGYDMEKGCSYYAEHDAVFPLDFEFTKDDLTDINKIRYSLSTILFSFGSSVEKTDISLKEKISVMLSLKDTTIKFLTKNRNEMEIHSVSHKWHEYPDSEFQASKDVYKGASIFPVHGIVEIKEMTTKDKQKLRQHCSDLRKLTSLPYSVKCELCETQIENINTLRTHLMTRLHLKHENEIGFTYEKL